MIETATTLVCDRCGQRRTPIVTTTHGRWGMPPDRVKQALDSARETGWRRRKRATGFTVDLCYACILDPELPDWLAKRHTER